MRRRLRCLTIAVLVALPSAAVAAGCSDDANDEVEQPAIPTATAAPTTSLVVELLDATGRPFCDVVDEVATSVQVWSDSSANYGTPDDVEQLYIGAYRAFDALAQVATREIAPQTGLLRDTLAGAVQAASAVGWDLTEVSVDADSDVDSKEFAQALAQLRRYTQERCGVDLTSTEPPVTTGPPETPRERQLRVVSETFPALTDEQVVCLADALPDGFDPDDPELDPEVVLKAFASCGITPPEPSRPSTTLSEG